MLLGLSACLAAVLLVQVLAVVVWLRSEPDSATLRAFTHEVAANLGAALSDNPNLDVQDYIDHRYEKPLASLFIVMADDGRAVLRGPLRPDDAMITGASEYYLERPRTSLPESWLNGPMQVAPILANGRLAGGVGVLSRQSWKELLGWKLALLSAGLLLTGTGLAARFVFHDVRLRLADLERTARRWGAGEFGVRAHAEGADELTALARAFNRMASDLGARDEQLKASDRARRLLLADVSHELMTPLTAVRAYREVLAETELARNPEAAQCLEVIGDETGRLEQLIGDLLDLSRLEAGGDSLRREDVSVENLFGRVAARHERDARLKGVKLSLSLGAGAEILYGDALRLEQALQNLAANAVRHTPPGGEVEVRADLSDFGIVLSVRDTGHGIPGEHLPHVFDRFYKVDPARAGSDAEGSGLGLSIVKAIVERHGGTVSVQSTPSVATVFSIVLPLSASAAAGRATRTGPWRASRSATRSRR
jgi:signal transduction histidine kinase